MGQSATLGTLYSRKNDEYYLTKNLWKAKTIEKAKQKQNKMYSNNKFFQGKTSAEKMDNMKISAELEMSFLGKNIQIYLFTHLNF